MLGEDGGCGGGDVTVADAEEAEEGEGDVVSDDHPDGVAGDGDVGVVVALLGEQRAGDVDGVVGDECDGVGVLEPCNVKFLRCRAGG